MKPKEQAESLVKSFIPFVNEKVRDNHYESVEWMNSKDEQLKNAKQCALISVNRIIDLLDDLDLNVDADLYGDIKQQKDIRAEIEKIEI